MGPTPTIDHCPMPLQAEDVRLKFVLGQTCVIPEIVGAGGAETATIIFCVEVQLVPPTVVPPVNVTGKFPVDANVVVVAHALIPLGDVYCEVVNVPPLHASTVIHPSGVHGWPTQAIRQVGGTVNVGGATKVKVLEAVKFGPQPVTVQLIV